MAKVTLNTALTHLQGMLGDVVFKRRGDRIFVSRRPRFKKRKPKPAEQKRRKDFAAANKYASGVLRDPEQKAAYAAAAKKLRRTIQNLAISDYLTLPQIERIANLRAESSERITIHTPDAYKIVAMHVILRDAAGREIERGDAQPAGKTWTYLTTQPRRTAQPLTLEATAADRLGKTATKTVEVVFKA